MPDTGGILRDIRISHARRAMHRNIVMLNLFVEIKSTRDSMPPLSRAVTWRLIAKSRVRPSPIFDARNGQTTRIYKGRTKLELPSEIRVQQTVLHAIYRSHERS